MFHISKRWFQTYSEHYAIVNRLFSFPVLKDREKTGSSVLVRIRLNNRTIHLDHNSERFHAVRGNTY